MVRKKKATAAASAATAAAAGNAATPMQVDPPPPPAPSAAPPTPADPALGTEILEETPNVFEAYRPTISIGKPHPSPAVESGLLSSVPLPPLTYDASGLPKAAIAEGRLSSLQLESVLYAGRRHQLLVPAAAASASSTSTSTGEGASLGMTQQQQQEGGGPRSMVRAGFFLGDGTGIGKGRQIAAMVLDNVSRGRKKHLWVSTSVDLKNEAARDFEDLGAPGIVVRDVHELDAATKALGVDNTFKKPSCGLVLFCTYSSLISARRVNVPKGPKLGPLPSGPGAPVAAPQKVKRVDQLIEFLGGKDFQGLVIFDEAHRAKSYRVDKPEASSQMSQAVLQLQQELPMARVVYASATGMQSLESMAYAQRLLLWGGANPSFPDFKAFQEKFMKRGDLSILELLAVEAKLSGAYMARSLSWEGAEFDLVTMNLSPEQKALYARCSVFFFALKEELEDAVKAVAAAGGNGGGGKGNPMKVYWSLQQRFFRDLLNSMKVQHLAGLAAEALAEGHCVVVGLQSTGEAGLAKILLEDAALPKGGQTAAAVASAATFDELPSAPKAAVKAFISKHFPTTVLTPLPRIPSVKEVEELHALKLAKGLPSDLQAALADREAQLAARAAAPPPEPEPVQALLDSQSYLLDQLEEIPVPPSPLDALIDALGGPGKVAEMTGRKGRMVRREDGKFHYQLRDSTAAAASNSSSSASVSTAAREEAIDGVNIQERAKFQRGEKLIAVLSDAASTGISLHSSLQDSCLNRRRRVHITLELAFSADKTLQQLGRTHRSNSSSAPIYKLLTTDAGGEQRFASAVARKLLSLGALTRGDRRAAAVIDFSSMNLESRAGGQALRKVCEFVRAVPEHDLANLVDFAVKHGQPLDDDVDMDDGQAIARALYNALDAIGLLEATNAQLTVGRFLNRLLLLPTPTQNLLFALFMEQHGRVVADAKQAGTLDEGVVDLSGTHVAIKGAPVTVWRDETTGASSEALTLELDRGAPFATALARFHESMEGWQQNEEEEEEPAFYLSRREQYGRRNVLLAIPKLSAPHLVYVTRPNTGPSAIEKDLEEILQAYDKAADPEEVKSYWDAIFEATEHHCMHGAGCKLGADCTQGGRKQTLRIVTGALVPIYTAMEAAIQKHRAQLVKNEAAMRVVRVTLTADGSKRVGIRFPTQPEVLATLQEAIAEAARKHAAVAAPVLEPITPVDEALKAKISHVARRKLTSFFARVDPKEAAAANALALAPPPPPAKGKGKEEEKKGKGKKKQKK